MIQVDTGLISIFVAVLLAILGLAAAWGAFSQRVKQHDKDIHDTKSDNSELRKENREDHSKIFDKLEEINKRIGGG